MLVFELRILNLKKYNLLINIFLRIVAYISALVTIVIWYIFFREFYFEVRELFLVFEIDKVEKINKINPTNYQNLYFDFQNLKNLIIHQVNLTF